MSILDWYLTLRHYYHWTRVESVRYALWLSGWSPFIREVAIVACFVVFLLTVFGFGLTLVLIQGIHAGR